MRIRHARVLAICLALPAISAGAQGSAVPTSGLSWSGFLDTYVAWDAGRPRTLDRGFSTTAARHAEFNVNLAHLAAAYESPNVRGRLAVQAGTSVQVNYAAEPRLGASSGPDLARLLQEAWAGVRLHEGIWIDAGIHFAPFGRESWISADNWTYTRSLILDHMPYYQSGVRLSWQAAPTLATQWFVLNGWQNISETNADKAIAGRLDWKATATHTLTWNGFVGNEAPDSVPAQRRLFHDLSWQGQLTDRLEAMATVNYGRQNRHRRDGRAGSWWGTSLIARRTIVPNRVWFALRGEAYHDPDRVIIQPAGTTAFIARGASLNLDFAPQPGVLWRTELRTLRGRDAVFADRDAAGGLSRQNVVLVSSLAWRF